MRARTEASSDRDLLAAVRAGDRAAYGVLWERHAEAVHRAATFFTSFEADDITAETFSRILKTIDRGHGPTDTFRAYALATARNVAAEWGRQPTEASVHVGPEFADDRAHDFASLLADDRSLAVRAFHSLPDRWQEVLWYSEVERMKPAEIAPLLGIQPNAVAALALRAREGLRQGWIQAHLRSEHVPDDHKWVIERASRYRRGALTKKQRAAVDAHLEDCPNCRLAYDEVDQATRRIASVLLITVLGPAATGYATLVSLRDAPAAQAAEGPLRPRVRRGRSSAGTIAGVAVTLACILIAGGIVSGAVIAAVLAPPSGAADDVSQMQAVVPPTASGDTAGSGVDSTPAPVIETVPSPEPTPDAVKRLHKGRPPIAPRTTAPVVPRNAEPSASASPTPEATPTPTPQPTPTPTPTPSPTPTAIPTPTPTPVPFAMNLDQPASDLIPHLDGTAAPGAIVAVTWTDQRGVATDQAAAADTEGVWALPGPALTEAGEYALRATTDAGDSLSRTVTIDDDLMILLTRTTDGWDAAVTAGGTTTLEIVHADGSTTYEDLTPSRSARYSIRAGDGASPRSMRVTDGTHVGIDNILPTA